MRELLDVERPLVTLLFELAAIPGLASTLRVQEMEDGGMGSLAIAPVGTGRQFGRAASECHFHDRDDVLVLATLVLDQEGSPFEIDVWKVDFSPLVQWPTRQALVPGSPSNANAGSQRRGIS